VRDPARAWYPIAAEAEDGLMEPDNPPIRSVGVWHQQAGPAAGQLPTHDQGAVPPIWWRRKACWVIATVVALVAAGIGAAITNPLTSGGNGVADSSSATAIYTVARQDLSSQTEVPATLGYAGAFSITAPSGAGAQEVARAQQAVTQDRQTLSADQQYGSDTSTSDSQAIARDRTNISTDQSALSSDQATEKEACAGSGASGAACSQDEQKVSEDQDTLTQAQQQLAAAQSTATLDHDQDQAKVQSDETKLQGDQQTLSALQATAVNPGTTYTWLPQAGEVIREDQRVYAVSDEPVPLLYGSAPAYRAFYTGMPDGADVGELTKDLIALGYGDGLSESNHYSASTAVAVGRWQEARGLPVTGEILLGQVVFEPGPIEVTSVTPSVGRPVGGGGGSGGSGGASGGGGGETVLTATSTTPQVSVALDAGEQSSVAVGDRVSITLPDNEDTPGVISSVGTIATAPSSSDNAGSSASGSGSSESSGPTITVLVNPTDPTAIRDWDQAAVNVTITTGSVTNALVVPVDALLAQPGGGYAVEVVGAGDVRHLVSVGLGLFDDADGLVQVTGTGLAAGQKIVVPNL
jgi:hypothetical protein